MKFRFHFLAILFLAIGMQTFAQSPGAEKVTEDKVLVAALDPIHQIYYINNKRQLMKLVPAQNRTYLYTDLFVDGQTVIQAQNPFKLMLYKKDVGTLITLDSRLNVTGRINLFDLGYFDVTALAAANDNQSVWLFDRASQQLVRLDQQYKQVFFSPVMPQQIGYDLNPVYITEQEGRVYLVDREKGIFIFDNIGNYFKKLPLEGLGKVWVFGPRLLYYFEDQVWQYDLMMMEKTPIVPLPGYRDVFLSRDFILALTEDGQLFKIAWPARH